MPPASVATRTRDCCPDVESSLPASSVRVAGTRAGSTVDRAVMYSGVTSGFKPASQAGWAEVVRVQAVANSRATRVGASAPAVAVLLGLAIGFVPVPDPAARGDVVGVADAGAAEVGGVTEAGLVADNGVVADGLV